MWREAEFSVCFVWMTGCPAENVELWLGEINYKYCIDLGAALLQIEVKLWALACSLVIDSCGNSRWGWMAGTNPVEARERNVQNEESDVVLASAVRSHLLRRMGRPLGGGHWQPFLRVASRFRWANSACCLIMQAHAFVNKQNQGVKWEKFQMSWLTESISRLSSFK